MSGCGEAVRLPRLLARELAQDGNTLREQGRLHPIALSAEISLAPLSRAEMTLADGELTVKIHDLVELYGQNGSLGIFRVCGITADEKGQRRVEMNHALDLFSDAVVEQQEDTAGTVAEALARICAAQTAGLGGRPCWQLGTVEDTAEYTLRGRCGNAMQHLTEIARREAGYRFAFDFSCFPWKLHFLRLTDEVSSEFRLNRNVESCRITLDDSALCTRLYLARDRERETEDGTVLETVYSVHDAEAAQREWGVVCRAAALPEGVADADAWARQYLDEYGKPGLAITVDGLELNRLTGDALDRIQVGLLCRVTLPEHSMVFSERVVRMQYGDLLRDPMGVTVSLNSREESAAGTLAQLDAGQKIALTRISANEKEIINQQFRSEVKLERTEGALHSEISLTAREIRLEASNSRAEMESALSVQAEAISSKVSRDGVISSINQTAEQITIQAQKIDLSGYVTANRLQAEIASMDAAISAGIITDDLQADNAYITYLQFGSQAVYWQQQYVVTEVNAQQSGQQVTGVSVTGKTIYYLGRV